MGCGGVGGGGGAWPFMDVVFVLFLFEHLCVWMLFCFYLFVFGRLCVGMLFWVLVCLTVYVFGCCFCFILPFMYFDLLLLFVLGFRFCLVFAVLPFQHRTHTQFPSRLLVWA